MQSRPLCVFSLLVTATVGCASGPATRSTRLLSFAAPPLGGSAARAELARLSSDPALLGSISAPAPDDGPNEAQRRSLDSPWTGARGEPGWSYDFVVGVESEPEYAGSDDNETDPDAFARALYEDRHGHRYFASLGEVGAWWKLDDDWALGTVLEYEEGREAENSALDGFDDGDDTVEAQLTLARRFGDYTVAAVFQPEVLDGDKGNVFFVAAGWDRMLNDRLRLGLSADVSWGDGEHMDTEFAVNSRESAAGGLDEYDPEGGLKSTTVGVGLEWFFADRWSLISSAELEYYFSEASDSPLIDDEGSDVTFEFGLGVRYSF